MKSLTNYMTPQYINENQLFTEYGKYIDSALHKFHIYNYNLIHRSQYIYEHYSYSNNYDITLSINEQHAVSNLLYLVLENYKQELERDLINESLEDIQNFVRKTRDKGKEIINSVKTKITAVNEILQGIVKGTIKTVKDISKILGDLFIKLDCTAKAFFDKIHITIEDKEIDEFAEEAAKKIDNIKKQNIFEAYGENLLIEKDNNEDISAKGDALAKKTPGEMVRDAFKQLFKWFMICVAIPGTAILLFPGSWVAVFVGIACKVIWTALKIGKIIKKGRVLFNKGNWDKLSRKQKIIQGGSYILSIIAIAYNAGTIMGGGLTIIKELSTSVGSVWSEAAPGVQPDALARAFAAGWKTLFENLKGNSTDFFAVYENISKGFTKIVTDGVTYHVQAGAKIGKNANEIIQGFNGSAFKRSIDAWTKFFNPNSIPTSDVLNKVGDNDTVQLVIDGVIKQGANSRTAKLIQAYQDWGGNPQDLLNNVGKGFNKGLNKICANAGAITGVNVPGGFIKWCIQNKVDLGGPSFAPNADGIMHGIAVLGSTAEPIVSAIPNPVEILSSLWVTLPSIEILDDTLGKFRVRLGGPKDKNNFVYEIDKGNVREVAIKDVQKDIKSKNSKAWDEFMSIAEKAVKDVDELKNNIDKNKNASDKDKEKAKAEIDKKLKELKNEFNNQKVIVYYGTKVKENKSKEEKTKKTNEALSLSDYIIMEKASKYTKDDLGHWMGKYLSRFTVLTDNKDCKDKDPKLWDELVEKLKIYQTNFRYIKINQSKFKLVKDVNNEVISIETKGATPDEISDLTKQIRKVADDYANKELDALIDKIKKLSSNTEVSDDLSKSLDTKQQAKLLGLSEVPDSVSNDEKDLVPTQTSNLNSDTENNTTQTEETSDKQPEKASDKEPEEEGVVPVLFYSPIFMSGADIANATDKGPRQEIQVMKELYQHYEYIQIENGMSDKEIDDMCSKMMVSSVHSTYNCVADKPCLKDKDAKQKYIINARSTVYKSEDERDDFGKFTNLELTDILNNEKNVMKYLMGHVSAAETEDEKQQLEQDKKTAEEKLKKDTEIQKQIQNDDALKEKYVKSDGTIDYTLLSNSMAERKMAQRKSKKKGLWAWIKRLLHIGEEEGKSLDNLNSQVYESASYDGFIIVEDKHKIIRECKSLTDYIKQQ